MGGKLFGETVVRHDEDLALEQDNHVAKVKLAHCTFRCLDQLDLINYAEQAIGRKPFE